MRRRISAGCVLFVMGCANESFTKNESAAADTAWTAEDTADTDADQEDAVEPVWWRLDAAVTVLAGAPEASTSRLSLTLISADGEALCEDTLGVTEILDVGKLNEVVIKAEKLTLVIRVLNPDYFLALALAPEGNFGKGRYLMRVVAPALQAEL